VLKLEAKRELSHEETWSWRRRDQGLTSFGIQDVVMITHNRRFFAKISCSHHAKLTPVDSE